MTWTIRRAKDDELDEIAELDRFILGVPWEGYESSEIWIALTHDGYIGAYGSARASQWLPGWAYLDRCATAKWARQQGLHRRLLTARLRWARRQGFAGVFTYTIDNPPSARNLIRAGFLPFEPTWTGWRADWWFRRLTAPRK